MRPRVDDMFFTSPFCRRLVFLLGGLGVVLLLLLLPLADLALVGLFAVKVGEDEVEDLRVPGHRMALKAFLDVLLKLLVRGQNYSRNIA